MTEITGEKERPADNRAEFDESGARVGSLSCLLTEDRIQIGLSADGWREALRLAAGPLVRNGDVEPRYVDAMIDLVESIGPYMVIAPGVALPHARPEHGALRVCVSITVLRSPVEFGSVNDPVWLLCAFAAVDERSHVLLLRQIASLLSSEHDVEAIRTAAHPSEVLELVHRRFA